MSVFIFYFLVLELLVISYIDFRYQKIHNLWVLLNCAFYILLLFLFPQQYLFNIKTFVFPLAFIFVGYILYVMNIMGAGDSKFLFSFFLLVPVAFHEKVFLCLAYSTVLVGGFLFISTIVLNFKKIVIALKLRDVGGIKQVFGSKFTYAPVIFIAWIWFGWIQKLFLP